MQNRLLLLPLLALLGCSKAQHSGPYVTTPSVKITSVVASGSSIRWEAQIISDGNLALQSKGICWSTLPGPTIAGNHAEVSTAGDIFSHTISGLTPFTTYYLRAYATNAQGTGYSTELTITL